MLQGSETLSSDTELGFDQFREFSIRFGLLSEKQALEATQERELLNELWEILSRKQQNQTSIKILNLKTIVTAMLGFPIMVVDSKRPYAGKSKQKKASKPKNRQGSSHDEFEGASEFNEEELQEDFQRGRSLAPYGSQESASKGLNPALPTEKHLNS